MVVHLLARFRTGSAQFHLLAATFAGSIQVLKTSANCLPANTAAEVATRYHSGETPEAIATALGVNQNAVRRVLDQLGEPRRTSCPVSGVHRQTILDQHVEGKSIKEISTDLGLNFATVYRVLRRAGRVRQKGR